MTDFSALIDRAISQETQSNIATFLACYQLTDGGGIRKLRRAEVALIAATMDAFLSDNRIADRVLTEVVSLCSRLNEIAAKESLAATPEGTRIRNVCFDALACIKALEVCVLRQADRSAISPGRAAPLASPANDS